MDRRLVGYLLICVSLSIVILGLDCQIAEARRGGGGFSRGGGRGGGGGAGLFGFLIGLLWIVALPAWAVSGTGKWGLPIGAALGLLSWIALLWILHRWLGAGWSSLGAFLAPLLAIPIAALWSSWLEARRWARFKARRKLQHAQWAAEAAARRDTQLAPDLPGRGANGQLSH